MHEPDVGRPDDFKLAENYVQNHSETNNEPVKMRYLAIIPKVAQKGSKKIFVTPCKPLISWTINAAKASTLIDDVILSSDDPEIISVAKEYGCRVPFIREAGISQDKAPSIDVVFDAVKISKF